MQKITFTYNDIALDVNFSPEENTVWLNQKDMVKLFHTNQSNISGHLNNILKLKTDENDSTYRFFRLVASNGKSYNYKHYNLDIIKEVGYKINPSLTVYFIDWCKEEIDRLNNQLIPTQSNIIRFEDDNLSLDVKVLPEEETVYLDQDGLGKLFDTTKPNISMHIKNIYDSGELDERATVKDFLIVQMEGNREVNRLVKMYNLDLIISLGYRVNSKRGIMFRRWATRVLKEYMLKGYAIDEKRVMDFSSNLESLTTRVNKIEKKVDTLVKQKDIEFPNHKIFYENSLFEATSFLSGLIEAANSIIVLFDPYIDIKALEILSYKKESVRLYIITTSKAKIKEDRYKDVIEQYKDTYIYIDDSIHDRYLIIDDSIYYHMGSSINYMGKYFTQISKMKDEEIINVISSRYKRIIIIHRTIRWFFLVGQLLALCY